MVTARARVPAMACVGGPAAGRARVGGAICGVAAPGAGSLSHRSLIGRWRNLGCRRSKEQSARLCAPKFGTSLWRPDGHTHTHTDNSKSGSPGQNLNRVARTLFSRGRLISEASLPVFQRGWEGLTQISTADRTHAYLCSEGKSQVKSSQLKLEWSRSLLRCAPHT